MRNGHPSKGIVIPKKVIDEYVYTKKERRPNDASTRMAPLISKAGLNLTRNNTPFIDARANVT